MYTAEAALPFTVTSNKPMTSEHEVTLKLSIYTFGFLFHSKCTSGHCYISIDFLKIVKREEWRELVVESLRAPPRSADYGTDK